MNAAEEEFNKALGRRLSIIRRSKRMSLDELGVRIGVRGQQIFKYEIGENRMSPERLAQCARIFKVPIGYFYGEKEDDDLCDYTILSVAEEVKGLSPEIRQLIYKLFRALQQESILERLIIEKDPEQDA